MASIRVTAQVRRAVAERARFCCEYCWSQESYATQSFSVEHILARYHGGKNHLDNLALACQGCNNHKHKHTKLKGVDPATGQLARLFHPRHDRWQTHFTWNEDFTRCSSFLNLTLETQHFQDDSANQSLDSIDYDALAPPANKLRANSEKSLQDYISQSCRDLIH
jgi:HNH endonuclease